MKENDIINKEDLLTIMEEMIVNNNKWSSLYNNLMENPEFVELFDDEELKDKPDVTKIYFIIKKLLYTVNHEKDERQIEIIDKLQSENYQLKSVMTRLHDIMHLVCDEKQ